MKARCKQQQCLNSAIACNVNVIWNQQCGNSDFPCPPTLMLAHFQSVTKARFNKRRQTERMRKLYMEQGSQRMHGKGGEWGKQPRMNPNRNSKRVEGQRNLLMLPASSSSALSFFMFLVRVKFSQLLRMFHSCCLFVYPPPPILHNFLSHFSLPSSENTLLDKTYIIEKLLPAFWRTFTELDFVAAGKEPKKKKINKKN